MDFLRYVSSSASGSSWWNQLCAEANPAGDEAQQGAHALRLHINDTKLFMSNPRHPEDIASFCQALEEFPTGASVKRAQDAIDRCQTMICVGPKAESLDSAFGRLLAFQSFLEYYCDDRGPRSPAVEDRIWEKLRASSQYTSTVKPAAYIRSVVPCTFWTALKDIQSLEKLQPLTAGRLRQFLGLRDGLGRCLLIQIKSGKEPESYIPTGWDGFDNPHFRENKKYDPADPSTHYGYTWDHAMNQLGAREVVSLPIPTEDTILVRRYE